MAGCERLSLGFGMDLWGGGIVGWGGSGVMFDCGRRGFILFLFV